VKQNEPSAGLRTIPLRVVSLLGVGVPGINWGSGTILLRAMGGGWFPATNVPVETVGGADGSYELELTQGETFPLGPLFYSVAHPSIRQIISAVMIEGPTGSFARNEPLAALRTVPLYLVDLSGDGADPGSFTFAAGDSKVHKFGAATWVNSVNLPVAVTGGPDGCFTLELTQAEIDTAGDIMYQVTHAGITTLVDAITVEDNPIVNASLPVSTRTWNYDYINQAITDQGSSLATNRRYLRTFKNTLANVLGAEVGYSCNGVTAGVQDDGLDRWVTDANLKFGAGAYLHSSWFVWKFGEMQQKAAFAKVTMLGDFGDYAVFVARAPGPGGNAITLEFVQTGDPGDTAVVTEVGYAVTVTVQADTSIETVRSKITSDSTLLRRQNPDGWYNTIVNSGPTALSGGDDGHAGIRPSELLINLVASGAASYLYLFGGSVIVVSLDPGLSANDITLVGYGDSPPTTGVFLDETNPPHIIVHYESGVSTRQDVVDALNTSTLVQAVGGDATILTAVNDDFVYDWHLATPSFLAPTSRAQALMAYDPVRDRAVLFGGYTYTATFSNDTWEYDGSAWAQMSPTSSPTSGRFLTPLVYDATNAYIFMFGGYRNSPNVIYGDTWSYDGTTWTQLFPATSPSARLNVSMSHNPVLGKVVLFGGEAPVSTYHYDTWEWDGTTWTHVFPATTPTGITGRSCFHVGSGKTVMQRSDGTTWTYDGVDWTLEAPATANSEGEQSMTYDSVRDRIVAYSEYRNGVREWDGTNWFMVSAPNVPGNGQLAFFTTGNYVLSACGDYYTSSAYKYYQGSTVTERRIYWNSIYPATPPVARMRSAMVYDPVLNKTILMGGHGPYGTPGVETWEFNGTQWTQRSPTTTPTIGYEPTGVYSANLGGVFIVGHNGDGNGYLWDGADWTLISIFPGAWRSSPALGIDPTTGDVILFGGHNVSNVSLNDTWRFDGASWTLLSPATSPSIRSGARMVLDVNGGELVLFGGLPDIGIPTAPNGETWVWDGTNWTQRFPVNSPSPRSLHGLAYDSVSQQVVLFGGADGVDNGLANDTWFWNGTNWSSGRIAYGPPYERHPAGMVFDSAANRIVLFGGQYAIGFSYDVSGETIAMTTSGAMFQGGSDENGNLAELYMSRRAGFTGGTTTARPTATDETFHDLALSSIPGTQYPLHVILEAHGLEWRLLTTGSGLARLIHMGQAHTDVEGWTEPTLLGEPATSVFQD